MEQTLATQNKQHQKLMIAHAKLVEDLRRQLEGTSTAVDAGPTEPPDTNQNVELASDSLDSSQEEEQVSDASLSETDTADHSMPTNAAVASG